MWSENLSAPGPQDNLLTTAEVAKAILPFLLAVS